MRKQNWVGTLVIYDLVYRSILSRIFVQRRGKFWPKHIITSRFVLLPRHGRERSRYWRSRTQYFSLRLGSPTLFKNCFLCFCVTFVHTMRMGVHEERNCVLVVTCKDGIWWFVYFLPHSPLSSGTCTPERFNCSLPLTACQNIHKVPCEFLNLRDVLCVFACTCFCGCAL